MKLRKKIKLTLKEIQRGYKKDPTSDKYNYGICLAASHAVIDTLPRCSNDERQLAVYAITNRLREVETYTRGAFLTSPGVWKGKRLKAIKRMLKALKSREWNPT